MEFEFGANAEVASLDMVPEPFRPFYAAGNRKDGSAGFLLQDTYRSTATAVDGLNKALRGARQDLKNKPDLSPWLSVVQTEFPDLSEVTPDALAASIAKLKQDLTAGKDGTANWDKIRRTLEEAHTQALTKKDGEIQGMQKSLENYMIGQQAAEAISAAKGVPALLMPHIQSQCKVVRLDNGNYEVRIVDASGDFRGDTSGGFLTVKQLVEQMKTDPIYSRAFDSEAPGSSSGGTPPGSTYRSPGAPPSRPGQGNGAGGPPQLTANERIARGLAARAARR